MPEAGELIEEKYRLVRTIGQGGMATVWEAEHVRLKSKVAVKLIHTPHAALGGYLGRFLEEAQVAAAINHRNVIDIIDFGTTEDGVPFMVMELLLGDTLADRIEERAPLPIEEAVELGAQILSALAAVHESGIIHRDLKPENVMFGRDADGTFPKLVDFGISKNVAAEAEGTRRPKTREGLLLGTPQYMSPEQARGLKNVDHRTDLYAAGVILYEMLTGQRPYDSENVGDLLIQVLEGDAPLVSTLRPDVPEELAELVTRAMAYEREERFGDARTMRRALIESIKGGVKTERPGPLVPRPTTLSEVEAPAATPPATASTPASEIAVAAPAPTLEETENAAITAQPEGPAFDDTPRRVELPDPEPMPLPSPERARLIRTLIIVGIVAAALAAPEIARPGLYASFFARTREQGARLRTSDTNAPPQGGIDAGLERVDAGFIWVRLRGVPRNASVLIDGRRLDPEVVAGLFMDDGTLGVPVPMKRGGPFELRVEAPGRGHWQMRRWTVQDFDLDVHFSQGRRHPRNKRR